MQLRPRYFAGQGQGAVVPAAAAAAQADGKLLVVQQQRQAVGARGLAQGGQVRQAFGRGHGAQQAQGGIVVDERGMPGLQGGLAAVHPGFDQRRQPGPFVDVGGGVQPIGRCGEGQAGTAGVLAHGHRAIRPPQCGARPGKAPFPGVDQRRRDRRADHRLQHRARFGEIQVRAGQAAQVVERRRCCFTHAVLNRCLRRGARTPVRVPRGPRPPSPPPPPRRRSGSAPATAVRPACPHAGRLRRG